MTHPEPTHYEILEVPPHATFLEIKRAYRDKAKQFHPDRLSQPSEEDQGRFARIAEAYRVLSNLERRRSYDATLQPSGAAPPPPGAGFYRPHYSGYPYFQWDIFTPYMHAFFMGSPRADTSPRASLVALLLNPKTLGIAILGALYFFKFFTSIEGIVVEKKVDEQLFNTTVYVLMVNSGEGEPKRKKVKYELYDRIQVKDRINKPFFSMTYRINEEEIPGPGTMRFLGQVALIYLVITGGLYLLEVSRK